MYEIDFGVTQGLPLSLALVTYQPSPLTKNYFEVDPSIYLLHPTALLQQTSCDKMATPPQDDPKPNGALFDDFFESIGKKAEQLTIDDKDKSGDQTAQVADDEQKVVDEIESLCMNCHENASYLIFTGRYYH